MEKFLRCCDFPNFGPSVKLDESLLQVLGQVVRQSVRAKAIILNTFEDLDSPIVSFIRSHCNPKVFTVGPLHAHRQHSIFINNSTFFQLDRTCIQWLNSQPPNSVVYVSFGSLAAVSEGQLTELWHGLVASEIPFLWALRPELSLLLSSELGTDNNNNNNNGRGFISGWVPQEEVLSHRSVGGFLTHGGWNSTVESMVAGVPMICWPYFSDQQINSRFVAEVWRIGIDMKLDVCDRKVVAKMVRDLMVERRDEFLRSTAEMAELAKRSVAQGGSSYSNLNNLIEDIKLMRK